MQAVQKAYLQLHLAVLLFGFTAILGDLITLAAFPIVWWRVLITSVSLLFLVRLKRMVKEIPRKLFLQYAGIGVLVAIHWVTFYGAIKLSNASITLVCMATTSFFTSLLEPLILRRPIAWYELALGILIIPGMMLIASDLESGMMLGVWTGLASAFLAALFAIFNKVLIDKARPMAITLIELSSSWLFLTLCLPLFFFIQPEARMMPEGLDWGYLVILALLCTTLAYVLSLLALKHLTAFASNLTVNLEPVYGVLLAMLILKEHQELEPNFYWGMSVILLAVFSYPILKRKFGKPTNQPTD
ncbi:MAG: DMT family transporter [Bacteroidetes bacterium]|nr:DMT family transporter [Bacteroidota bacterium]